MEKDFEAVNRLAMEQISRLEKGDSSALVPQITTSEPRKGGFWSNDFSKSSLRPSNQGTSEGTRVPLFGSMPPRSFYSSRSAAYDYYNPDSFYRKTLNAIYRHKKQEGKDENNEEMVVAVITKEPEKMRVGGLLFSNHLNVIEESVNDEESREEVRYEVRQRHVALPRISPEAKHQMLAIILSGFTRMASTMVLNWAKERDVPYELLV